jgi:hypothetical protein
LADRASSRPSGRSAGCQELASARFADPGLRAADEVVDEGAGLAAPDGGELDGGGALEVKESDALGVDIRLGGVPVSTGNLVVGDADGVVVLPAARVPDVLDRADARVAQEATILEQLRAGATTLELYGLAPRGQS